MKHTPCLLVVPFVAIALPAYAVSYTYGPPSTGTGGTDNWSTSTFWNVTPISGIDTQLIFGGTLDAAAAVVTNNDIASPPFQLNNLTYNAAGPATGTAPTYAIQGSQLQFINSSGAIAPTMTLNSTGTVKPTLTISNAINLDNTLTISATTGGTLSGLISGANSLVIDGGATVTLANNGTGGSANSFGGVGQTITVQGGSTLRTTSNSNFNSLGSGSNKIILSGGTYIAGGGNDFGTSFNRALEFVGTGNAIRNDANASSRELWIGSVLTGSGDFTTSGTDAPNILGNLSGVSTYSGTATAASQTLYVGANGTRDALASGNVTLNGASVHFGGNSGTPVDLAAFNRTLTVSANNGLSVANNYTFNLTGTLTGAATLSLNNVTLSQEAKGTVAAINGAGSNSVIVINGNVAGFSGNVVLSRGTLRIGANGIGSGTLTMSNAAASATTAITSNTSATRNIANTLGTFAGTTATYAFGSTDSTFNGDLNFNSTTSSSIGTGARTFEVHNTTTFANGFSSSGSITKTGEGTMALNNASTYTGGTTINAGTLRVNNTTGSGVGTGDLVINGGTLSGSGLVGQASDASNVTFGDSGGTIAPGTSPGILTVNGGVDFTTAGTATFEVELDGLVLGTQYDQLVVNTATGGGTINLANATLSVLLGFAPAINSVFTIIDNNTASAVTGNFSGLLDNNTFVVNTTTFRIDYDGGILGGGQDVVLTVVPEPGTLVLAGAGLVMVLGRARRVRACA